MTWRENFRPLVAEVIDRHRGSGLSLVEIRRKLRTAYPCNQYMGFARRAWLAECRAQLLREPQWADGILVRASSRADEDEHTLPLQWWRK